MGAKVRFRVEVFRFHRMKRRVYTYATWGHIAWVLVHESARNWGVKEL